MVRFNLKIKYFYNLNGNVSAHINDKVKLLHRYLLNYDRKDVIDHINNNPLDNRKCNLRIVTKNKIV